ncbi:MAG: hypothetical protein AAF483_02010 [Planctomycetota bacterium]
MPTVHKPASKVQLDASWFAPSGMPSEQIDQLVKQRKDHIAAVQAERKKEAASSDSPTIALPNADAGRVSGAAAVQDDGLRLEFGENK